MEGILSDTSFVTHGNSAGVLNAADGFSLDEALNLLELFIERPDARRLFREEGGDVRLMEGPAGKAGFLPGVIRPAPDGIDHEILLIGNDLKCPGKPKNPLYL